MSMHDVASPRSFLCCRENRSQWEIGRSHAKRLGFWVESLLAALGVLLPVALEAQMQPDVSKPQHVLRYKSSPGQPLTVITANDPGFDTEMALDFPDYLDRPNYAASKPLLVILRNDTPKTVRAYELFWHLQMPDDDAPNGMREHTLTNFAITTPLELRRPGGLRQLDKSIRPGEARLLSPLFNGGREDGAEFSLFNFAARLPDPSTYAAIKVDVDCVIYGDGSSAGLNRGRLRMRYFVARDAQHDEALSILRWLRAHPNDMQVRKLLDIRMKIGAANTHPNLKAVPTYIHARSIAAQEFEEILDRGGYSELQRTAEELVTLMPPHEKFTTLDGYYHRAKFVVDGVALSPMD
jgi:hypothetical protein